MNYNDFLNNKSQTSGYSGFKPLWIPDYLKDFQKYLVDWSLRKGKGANFADTGLGKTVMFLVWAENIVRKTNKNVLILTPLAVSTQTITEGAKFGIEVKRSRDGQPKGKITVTNYQQLEKFNSNDFIAIICDESSAIKNNEGQTKKNVVRFSGKMDYRLFCTATPSPNDFIELGTTSEALGELPFMEMLSQFFRDTSNDKNPQWSTPKYILKNHAIHDFWRWVVSWARAIRKPSDLGFDDSEFILPELIETEHILDVTKPLDGYLFAARAETLKEQREERKKTLEERAEKVIELCEKHDISVIWGHYNYETDFLERMIPNAIQISGSDSDEAKEEKFGAFTNGQIKKLVIKSKIGCWGLNWQHCNHAIFFPSHSYEQYYQAVRRFWRYGQKRKVNIDIVTTMGESGVMENVKRKARDAEKMYSLLVKYMNDELNIKKQNKQFSKTELPKWMN
jgi:superfamily II DNA or RNA helicase